MERAAKTTSLLSAAFRSQGVQHSALACEPSRQHRREGCIREFSLSDAAKEVQQILGRRDRGPGEKTPMFGCSPPLRAQAPAPSISRQPTRPVISRTPSSAGFD
eukprot:jgi/Botrbrau1/10254/Bobra.0140s0010.1